MKLFGSKKSNHANSRSGRTKRTMFSSALLVILAVLLIGGGTLAYLFTSAGPVVNAFTPATVSCEVVETYENNVKSEIKVQNTSNIDAYLRVRLVSYWADANGNPVGKASPVVSFTLGTDWVDGGNGVYYYTKPVAAGGFTTDLLGSDVTLVSEDGTNQVIDVFAEAIQAEPAQARTDAGWYVG